MGMLAMIPTAEFDLSGDKPADTLRSSDPSGPMPDPRADRTAMKLRRGKAARAATA
jgi:hypothetical protein